MENFNTAQTTVSEIEISHDNIASFSCFVDLESEMSIILHDRLGRSRLKKNFSLSPGENEISFRLPELTEGGYKAWIDVLGETFIRSIDIEGEPEGGFMSKFKGWLGLF